MTQASKDAIKVTRESLQHANADFSASPSTTYRVDSGIEVFSIALKERDSALRDYAKKTLVTNLLSNSAERENTLKLFDKIIESMDKRGMDAVWEITHTAEKRLLKDVELIRGFRNKTEVFLRVESSQR